MAGPGPGPAIFETTLLATRCCSLCCLSGQGIKKRGGAFRLEAPTRAPTFRPLDLARRGGRRQGRRRQWQRRARSRSRLFTRHRSITARSDHRSGSWGEGGRGGGGGGGGGSRGLIGALHREELAVHEERQPEDSGVRHQGVGDEDLLETRVDPRPGGVEGAGGDDVGDLHKAVERAEVQGTR